MNIHLLHIPKTGINSVLKLFRTHGNPLNPMRKCGKEEKTDFKFQFLYGIHAPRKMVVSRNSNLLIDKTICFKRCPYERFTSALNFLLSAGKHPQTSRPQQGNFQLGYGKEIFKQWFEMKYNNSIADLVASSDFQEMSNSPDFIWFQKAGFFVDWDLHGIDLYETENFASELQRLGTDIGMTVDEIPEINRTSVKTFTELTEADKEAIYDFYKLDFQLFDYPK